MSESDREASIMRRPWPTGGLLGPGPLGGCWALAHWGLLGPGPLGGCWALAHWGAVGSRSEIRKYHKVQVKQSHYSPRQFLRVPRV